MQYTMLKYKWEDLLYHLGYKAMALYPIQGHLAFWKIELVVTYKAIAIPLQGYPFLPLGKTNHIDGLIS